jgi:hypothetical protein
LVIKLSLCLNIMPCGCGDLQKLLTSVLCEREWSALPSDSFAQGKSFSMQVRYGGVLSRSRCGGERRVIAPFRKPQLGHSACPYTCWTSCHLLLYLRVIQLLWVNACLTDLVFWVTWVEECLVTLALNYVFMLASNEVKETERKLDLKGTHQCWC